MLDHPLRKYVTTPRQSQVLEAYIRNGESAARAAKEINCSRGTVRDIIDALKRKAGKVLPVEALPDDHRLKGVSTYTDGAGNIEHQWAKTEIAPIEPPAFEPVPEGFLVKGLSSYVDRSGKVAGQWITSKREEAEAYAALEAGMRASLESYVVPVLPSAINDWFDEDTCGIIPIGDPHIGMLAHAAEVGESSDMKIQERDLLSAMDHLVQGMRPSKRCRVILLGDNLHADDDRQVTPAHHHKLDVDGRSDKVARVAINVFRRVIDRALQRFQYVDVEVVGGNHDVVTSIWLRIALGLIYANEPRVWVNASPAALRVWSFGKCFFGTSHGDGIKPEHMLGVMAARYREQWGAAEFVYGYQGHRHHKRVIESAGGIVEIFRTLTGKDAFAAKFGYESGQDLIGITCHKDFGEIERKTVGKLLARSGLAT